ncbi:MAG: hypothetical protein VXA00_10730, partial [Rhodospirillales bacterium]
VTPSPTEKPDIKPTEPEVPKNLQEDSVQQLRDNLEKTDLKTTPVSYWLCIYLMRTLKIFDGPSHQN